MHGACTGQGVNTHTQIHTEWGVGGGGYGQRGALCLQEPQWSLISKERAARETRQCRDTNDRMWARVAAEGWRRGSEKERERYG